MSVTAEDLCAFLLDLDAPDRLDRPLLLAPDVVSAAVTRLSEALGAAFGHRCAVERLPEGHEHHGSVTVPGEGTSAGVPLVFVVGRYGLALALAPDPRHPDGPPLDEDDYTRTKEAAFATGFGFTSGVSGLTPWRLGRPYPRLFSARTAEELVRQIRGLPTGGGGPTADLREWLCATLDVPADGQVVERLPSLDVLTPEQVLAEVERVRLCVAALAAPEDSDERRLLAIDDTIVDGHNIRAIQALRNELGGGLQEAILAFHERANTLRRTRPRGCAAGRIRDVT